MNILMQIRQNRMLEYHSANVAQRFPYGRVVSRAEVDLLIKERENWQYFPTVEQKAGLTANAPSFPVMESIVWLANYYEFICVGVLSGDLDAGMIKRSQRSTMCKFYRKTIHVLNHFQNVDALGHPSNSTFLSLREIFEKWSTPDERKLPQDPRLAAIDGWAPKREPHSANGSAQPATSGGGDAAGTSPPSGTPKQGE